LELDQALGTIRPRLRPLRAALEFGDLLVPRIRRRRHRATLPRRRPELPVHPLRPPAGQVRRVQPLTPQQRRTAPFWSAQASASSSTRSFSAVVNRRRRAFAETSVVFAIPFIIADSSVALDTDLSVVGVSATSVTGSRI
jgi:hypothetical protein